MMMMTHVVSCLAAQFNQWTVLTFF